MKALTFTSSHPTASRLSSARFRLAVYRLARMHAHARADKKPARHFARAYLAQKSKSVKTRSEIFERGARANDAYNPLKQSAARSPFRATPRASGTNPRTGNDWQPFRSRRGLEL